MRNCQQGYKRVAVIKCGCVDYHYALYDENINEGDECLVSGVNKSIVVINKVITSEEAKEKFNKSIIEEVICKVDSKPYLKRLENRKKAQELQKKMDKKILDLLEKNKYSMYAEKDQEIAELYSEYLSILDLPEGKTHEKSNNQD